MRCEDLLFDGRYLPPLSQLCPLFPFYQPRSPFIDRLSLDQTDRPEGLEREIHKEPPPDLILLEPQLRYLEFRRLGPFSPMSDVAILLLW